MPVQTLRLAQPLLTQNKTMKKQLLTLALLAVAGTAGAQQLPNGSFDEGNWVDCVPWTSANNTTKYGTQPNSWKISNVIGFLNQGKTIVGEVDEEGRSGKAVRVYNNPNSFSPEEIVPGYVTLGTPWNTSTSAKTEKDGGTFGGISFKNKPDALRFYYKRSVTGTNTRSSVVAYLWNGTTTQKSVPGNIYTPGLAKKVNMYDRDINVLNMSKDGYQGGSVKDEHKLIAKIESYTTEQPTEWTEWTIPFEYVAENIGETPEKINVIFAASDYFNSSNVTDGVSMSIDDVELVYYSTLSSLKVNGTDIKLQDGVYEYNGVGSIAKDCVVATPTSKFATVAYSYGKNEVTVTVTANDGTSKEYKVVFPNAESIATSYKNQINVDFAEGVTSSANDVVISANSDNTINFKLNNFAFAGMVVGDILVPNVQIAWNGDKVHLTSKQNITIESEAFAGLKDMPMTLDADVDKDKNLTASLDITWNSQKIGVSVCKMPFDYSIDGTALTIKNGEVKAADYSTNLVAGLALGMTSIDLSGVTIADENFYDNVVAAYGNNAVYFVGNNNVEGDNIVKNGKAQTLTLIDEDESMPFGSAFDFTAAAVSYDREFNTDANYVQSFVLPFGFTVPAGTTVAELSSVNGDNLVFKPVTETVANKPYLVVTTDKDFINKLTNVQVKATTGADLTTTVDGVSHIGSYTAQSVEGVYGYTNGKFVKATTGSVKPFRTYVKVAGDHQAAPMAFGVNIEGTVTGINNATTAATAKEAIYNLQGVRVSGDLKHLTKGVYIVNGQKVVVK